VSNEKLKSRGRPEKGRRKERKRKRKRRTLVAGSTVDQSGHGLDRL
jgi:hypothetical protein